MEIIIDDITFSFYVKYGKKKSKTMEITQEGHITVSVPLKTPQEEILKYVESHKKALLHMHKQLTNAKYISTKKQYNEEENFLYLGRAYSLGELLNQSDIDIASMSDSQIADALKNFYIKKTRSIVKESVKHYEKIIGVKCKSITIVESASTWGTCNSQKDLTFNYRLSMAPRASIDYVVIHELCHIMHMNHDRSFWRKVGMYDKDYKQHSEFLDKFGRYMTC